MEALPSSASLPASHETRPTYDELSMRQTMLFSDILKDLKNLRSQLYSAAEYFEVSFTKDDQRRIVVDTLKDYAVKALVNTVDHLGSVSYKVNYLLDEKFDEVSGTEIRVSSIEQRIRTCQEFIDLEGLSQQSLVMKAPEYHKRYILPVDESMPESAKHAVVHQEERNLPKGGKDPHQAALHPTVMDNRSPSFRKIFSRPLQRGRSSSPTRKARPPSPSSPYPGKPLNSDKRVSSPVPSPNLRASSPVPTPNFNPLLRSGSFSIRSAAPNASNNARRRPENSQKSASMRMRLHAEREDQVGVDEIPGKSKRLLKALLSRRRSKNDETLYTYIDEY